MQKQVFKSRGLIVSCQALENEPLHGGDTMRKMALSAQMSGAIGIRTNGVHDIRSIKEAVDLPVIGIIKRDIPGFSVFITPTIGVDIGGTKINLGVLNQQGEVIVSCSLPTFAGRENVMDRVGQGIDQLLVRVAQEQPEITFRGMGIGTAGQVDWKTGSIRFASDLLPTYSGTQIKELLQARFGLPVYVDNDVNVLALAEKTFGAGRGMRQMLCLALGTGVGGAVIIDGSIVHGAWVAAGEIGHMSVNYRGPVCICGNTGCLEQYASGKGMERLMSERLSAIEPDRLHPTIDAKEIVARWLSGDAAAAAVMDEVIAVLGTAVASLIHIFNPQLIVIGGGVADAGEPFLSRVREEAAKKTMPSMYADVKIAASYRGSLSATIGAGLLVWET